MAEQKKALDIVTLDLQKISNLCDFFIILTGTSQTHIKAIADGICEGLRKQGIRKLSMEGYTEAVWVVLDYYDVIVHIFNQQTRDFYDLEHLWADAPKLITQTA